MTRTLTGLSLASLLGLVVACGGSAPPRPAEVPQHLRGPVTSTDVAGGEAAFRRVCASCHVDGGAPELGNRGADPGVVRTQVRYGFGNMPAVGVKQLSDDDLEAVLAYLQSVGGVATPAESVPVEPEGEEDDDLL
jgi:mono/diheme cytochrome c family protein